MLKTVVKRRASWPAAAIIGCLAVVAACGCGGNRRTGDGGSELLGLQNRTGWQIYPGGGYRYGPSIIVHPDGGIDMWTCSPGVSGGGWDYIRYRYSGDGGHTWTPDTIALRPTPGSHDALSVCDPGVIKLGGYYYVGYTSTENPNGTANELYLARATNPEGPYEKWSGTGWGNDPKPVVRYTGASTKYGIGEPSLVLSGGRLYLYYTHVDQTGSYTDLSIVDDPTTSNWPLALEAKGHVLRRSGREDSVDVKYVDADQRFLAVSVFDRFGPNATVATYQSADGVRFERTPFRGARVKSGAHNVGISGDEAGHITARLRPFIAYAYWPTGATWGDWPTHLDRITLQKYPVGTPVGGGVSSIVGGSDAPDWNWSGPKAWDGDPASTYSSESHGGTADATEWAFVDLGRSLSVAGVALTPRPGGEGFPINAKIQSSVDAESWSDVPGATLKWHASLAGEPWVMTFAAAVDARYIRVLATRLGADAFGNHYLQLGEISVQANTRK